MQRTVSSFSKGYISYIADTASFHSEDISQYIHCKIYANTLLRCELFWDIRDKLDIENQDLESVGECVCDDQETSGHCEYDRNNRSTSWHSKIPYFSNTHLELDRNHCIGIQVFSPRFSMNVEQRQAGNFLIFLPFGNRVECRDIRFISGWRAGLWVSFAHRYRRYRDLSSEKLSRSCGYACSSYAKTVSRLEGRVSWSQKDTTTIASSIVTSTRNLVAALANH